MRKLILTPGILEEGNSAVFLRKIRRLKAVLVLESFVNLGWGLLHLLPWALGFGGQEKAKNEEKSQQPFSPAQQKQRRCHV